MTSTSTFKHDSNPVPSTAQGQDKKLKNKIREMRNKRTGAVTRQMKTEIAKTNTQQNNKPKTKMNMKNYVKETVRQTLSHFNVDDPNLEQELIREITSNHIKDTTQLAQIISKKLQKNFEAKMPQPQPVKLPQTKTSPPPPQKIQQTSTTSTSQIPQPPQQTPSSLSEPQNIKPRQTQINRHLLKKPSEHFLK